VLEDHTSNEFQIQFLNPTPPTQPQGPRGQVKRAGRSRGVPNDSNGRKPDIDRNRQTSGYSFANSNEKSSNKKDRDTNHLQPSNNAQWKSPDLVVDFDLGVQESYLDSPDIGARRRKSFGDPNNVFEPISSPNLKLSQNRKFSNANQNHSQQQLSHTFPEPKRQKSQNDYPHHQQDYNYNSGSKSNAVQDFQFDYGFDKQSPSHDSSRHNSPRTGKIESFPKIYIGSETKQSGQTSSYGEPTNERRDSNKQDIGYNLNKLHPEMVDSYQVGPGSHHNEGKKSNRPPKGSTGHKSGGRSGYSGGGMDIEIRGGGVGSDSPYVVGFDSGPNDRRHAEREMTHSPQGSPSYSNYHKHSPNAYTDSSKGGEFGTNNSGGLRPTPVYSEQRQYTGKSDQNSGFGINFNDNARPSVGLPMGTSPHGDFGGNPHKTRPKDGHSEIQFDNGAVFEGRWKNGLRDGQGKQLWPDGAVYNGTWQADKISGLGTLVYPSGDSYEGEWKNNMGNGKGIYREWTGGSYSGNWIDDKMDGMGVEVNENGDVFEGNYCKGVKTGYGVYTWIDRSLYKGEWKNNKFNGEGEIWWADGRKYAGTWLNNKMHAHGKFCWPDGSVYEGEYVADKRHGEGRMHFPDGRVYAGGWKSGYPHGTATLILPNGKSRDGEWVHGKLRTWLN
jgi:hypothetical protein